MTQPNIDSRTKALPDDIKLLRNVIAGFVLVLLILLVLLSFWGLRETLAEVNRHFPRPTPTATSVATPTPAVTSGSTATPTAMPTPSTTAIVAPTPVATPTVTPGQDATSNNGITPTAIATPTPTENQNEKKTSLQAATLAARQHFITLAVVTTTMVLFPWVLLLAFAYQGAPRLYRDLEKDLKALGLYSGPEEIRFDLQREATRDPETLKRERDLFEKFLEKIKPELTEEDKAKATAQALASFAVGRGTGTGGPPPGLSPILGQEVYDEALTSHEEVVTKRKENERGRIGLTQRFGWREFLLPLLSMTPIVLVSFVWAFWPKATFGLVDQMVTDASLNGYFETVVKTMAPAAVAVITAYLFMAFGLVRRYHRSDITPGAYWEVMTRLIVVFLLGVVGSVLVHGEDTWIRPAAVAVGIVAGVFPIDTLRFLIKAALSWIQKLLPGHQEQGVQDPVGRLEQRHPLSFLDDLDTWDELRLTEEGIIGLQGMATADIAHLLIWTPFTTQQIVDWVNQSILFLAAGAELDVRYVRTFRKMGLRGASHLIEATQNEADKRCVVAAAQALQKAPIKDPMTLAQLDAARIQLKVKAALERVSQVKDKKKDDPLDGIIKTNITAAVSAVRDATELVDSAVTRVKGQGEMPAAALDATNSLQAKFKTASEKASDVEKALATAQDKVTTEDLASALKTLGDVLTGDPNANSQAQALVDALDRIAKPLAQTQAKAKDFEEKARAIQKKAESTQSDVPGEVGEAESIFNSLTGLAQDSQQRITADSILVDAVGRVNELVGLLTDVNADKPTDLLKELKKKDQWTEAGDGNKGKSYVNAEKLVSQTAEILRRTQAAANVVDYARSASPGMGAWPPLTMHVLLTLLKGLERNANLRRIQRYLTIEISEVPPPGAYKSNIDWLWATS